MHEKEVRASWVSSCTFLVAEHIGRVEFARCTCGHITSVSFQPPRTPSSQRRADPEVTMQIRQVWHAVVFSHPHRTGEPQKHHLRRWTQTLQHFPMLRQESSGSHAGAWQASAASFHVHLHHEGQQRAANGMPRSLVHRSRPAPLPGCRSILRRYGAP